MRPADRGARALKGSKITVAVPAPPDLSGICALRVSAPEHLAPLSNGDIEDVAEAFRMAIATECWPVVLSVVEGVKVEWVLAET